VRKELDETANFIERCGRGWESAFAFLEELSFAVDHLDAEAPAVGMLPVEIDAGCEGVALHEGVGVEEKDIVASALAQSLVVGFGESGIVAVGDEMHLREGVADHLDRSVGRVVVDDPYFGLSLFAIVQTKLLGSLLHRHEALLEEVLDVVIDYDD